jgi:hypothetical protein
MEDYVDDILAKYYTKEGYLEILDKIFTRLEKFNVKLNPKKCAFGVISKNLLGYIVSEEIEGVCGGSDDPSPWEDIDMGVFASLLCGTKTS